MSAGKWAAWYRPLFDDPTASPYGDSLSYQLGADWLEDCDWIEDWGCGRGWFAKFVDGDRYQGVDGSPTPFAARVADLTTYTSKTPGLFMRHVLEHNYAWRAILDNAVASFTDRMALILFTPLLDETAEIGYEADPGVPNIGFALDDLAASFEGLAWERETFDSPQTQYGVETIIRLRRVPRSPGY